MTPGRNDPCSCGSGKKFKRCCLSNPAAKRHGIGRIDVLNTGMGHNEIKIDGSNAIEIERGKRIVEDMLKRGYALFIHGAGEELIRVKRFDPKTLNYIIGAEATLSPEVEAVSEPLPALKGKRGRPVKEKAVPMEKAHVTSVGRSAGG